MLVTDCTSAENTARSLDEQEQHWHFWSPFTVYSDLAWAAAPRNSQVTVIGFCTPRLLFRDLALSKQPLSHCCSLSLWETWCHVAPESRPSWMCFFIIPLRLCWDFFVHNPKASFFLSKPLSLCSIAFCFALVTFWSSKIQSQIYSITISLTGFPETRVEQN